MKKVLSFLVAVVMLFSTFAIGISAKKSDPSLRFNEDGKFRILQIADLQDNAVLNPVAKDFIKAAIEREKPDLIFSQATILPAIRQAQTFSDALINRLQRMQLTSICRFLKSTVSP